MTDIYDPIKRSDIMSRVRSKGTGPERLVSRLVFSLGYRSRLNRADLPGCPDIALISLRKAVFVHGCFWHQHKGCTRSTRPQQRARWWGKKLDLNVRRDDQALRALS